MVVIKPRDLPLLRSAAMMALRLVEGAGLRALREGFQLSGFGIASGPASHFF
jgi:hypothetical protein